MRNLIDIFHDGNELLYCFGSDNEYRKLEVSKEKIAKAIGLNVKYCEFYDEFYFDEIHEEYYDFTQEELTTYLATAIPMITVNKVRRSVMATAWEMFKSGLYQTFAIALKNAWTKIKLTERLNKGIAYFQFKKADGTIRKAIGTLRKGNFYYSTKSKRTTPSNQIPYWDIEKRGWRSLKIENLLAIN